MREILVCKCVGHAMSPQKFHDNSKFTPTLQQFAVHEDGIMNSYTIV